jgi:hypothetical protein
MTERRAVGAGALTIGSDLLVYRLGYGAMRLTGPGMWGEYPDREGGIALLKRVVAVTCSSDRASAPRPPAPMTAFWLRIGHTGIMSSRRSAPFTYAEIRPYAVAESLDELCGPAHGVLELPQELAWSGRRRFDLDDDYDRAAAYKIVLEEGGEEHFRRFLNARLIRRYWPEIRPARQVQALWEGRFPELRRAG